MRAECQICKKTVIIPQPLGFEEPQCVPVTMCNECLPKLREEADRSKLIEEIAERLAKIRDAANSAQSQEKEK